MSRALVRMSFALVRVLNHRDQAILSSAKRLSYSRMGSFFSKLGYGNDASVSEPPPDNEFRSMSDAEWRQKLTPEQYHVCRLKGTERPFTGAYVDNKQQGMYTCICCGASLFESKTKFDSGSGWPSFYQTYKTEDGSETVTTKSDRSLGMTRTEVLCAQCDSHLGHVFPDGPRPTGLRYCINSVSLNFIPAKNGKM